MRWLDSRPILKAEIPDFIPPALWPSNNPDFSPVDYTIHSFIYLFVLDNKVHRLSLHKRTEQTDRDGYNLTTTQPADHCLNGRTHLTTALSQTATLLAKLTLQL